MPPSVWYPSSHHRGNKSVVYPAQNVVITADFEFGQQFSVFLTSVCSAAACQTDCRSPITPSSVTVWEPTLALLTGRCLALTRRVQTHLKACRNLLLAFQRAERDQGHSTLQWGMASVVSG